MNLRTRPSLLASSVFVPISTAIPCSRVALDSSAREVFVFLTKLMYRPLPVLRPARIAMVDEAVATPTPDAPLVVSTIPRLASNAARAAGSVAATASAARVVARARNGTGAEGASKHILGIKPTYSSVM